MAAYSALFQRSFRLLGVLQTGETPSSSMYSDAVAACNSMLNAWIHDGIDLEYMTITNETETFPYADDHQAAVVYGLAVELSPEYGKALIPEIAIQAQRYFDNLYRSYISVPDMSVDDALIAASMPETLFE